jgi:DNA-binding transcriptional ArsR family regulator
VGILRELRRGEKSPGEMATALGHPLGVVSYHVRMLRDYGAVELTRTEPRRGALQHFYAARKEVREMLKAFDRVAKATGRAQAERDA